MKLILNNVMYFSFCLMICTPIYSAQFTINTPIINKGTKSDLTADVNINGTVNAPLTVNIPTETLNQLKLLAAQVTCFGYGAKLMADGAETIINDNFDRAEERLKKGYKQQAPFKQYLIHS